MYRRWRQELRDRGSSVPQPRQCLLKRLDKHWPDSPARRHCQTARQARRHIPTFPCWGSSLTCSPVHLSTAVANGMTVYCSAGSAHTSQPHCSHRSCSTRLLRCVIHVSFILVCSASFRLPRASPFSQPAPLCCGFTVDEVKSYRSPVWLFGLLSEITCGRNVLFICFSSKNDTKFYRSLF